MEITFRGHTIKYNQRPEFWEKIDVWENHSFNILDKYIEKGKVFIDCGAWNGVLSIYASLLGAKVYSIEPDDYAWAEMIENRELNGLDFVASQTAISHSKGWTTIKSTEFGNSESGFFTNGNRKQTTPTETLEGYITQYKINPEEICLIKADCEGAELYVIPSSKNFLQTYKPKIYLSMHPLYYWDKLDIISDVIYPIYTVADAQSGEEILQENFDEAMRAYKHSLLLLPR